MSADPNQIAQLIALYKQQFPGGMPQQQAYQQAQAPGQAALHMGNAPAGTNTAAGGTNALAKLMLALMQRKRMQDYNQQYPQQGTTPMGGPTTPTTGAAPGVGGGAPPGL
jgi:hypothetical protein